MVQFAPLGYQVSDVLGNKVVEVLPVPAGIGNHTFILDGTALSPGIYTLSVTAGKQTVTKKMVIQ